MKRVVLRFGYSSLFQNCPAMARSCRKHVVCELHDWIRIQAAHCSEDLQRIFVRVRLPWYLPRSTCQGSSKISWRFCPRREHRGYFWRFAAGEEILAGRISKGIKEGSQPRRCHMVQRTVIRGNPKTTPVECAAAPKGLVNRVLCNYIRNVLFQKSSDLFCLLNRGSWW